MVINPRTAGVKTPQMKAILEDHPAPRQGDLPGVEGASYAGMALMRGIGMKRLGRAHRLAIRTADFLNTSLNTVSLGHFENVGIRILAGRDFRPADIGAPKPAPVDRQRKLRAPVLSRTSIPSAKLSEPG